MEERHFGPIWFIPGENGGRYPFCHSVYIQGPGILIDPGSDRKRLSELRQSPGVRAVWLSHWHEDHLSHLDLFEDLPIWISPLDVPPLAHVEAFMDAYGISEESHRVYWREVLKEQFRFRPRKPTRFLQGGQTMALDGVTVEVIASPGHTPGHLAFFFKEPHVLFLGDYDLSRFGPWYGDAQGGIDETIGSVSLLRDIPARVWLASHMDGCFEESPGERWDQYLRVIDERDRKLLAFLERPHAMQEIVDAWLIYGKPREPKGFFEFGERALMTKHLERLMKKGRVIPVEEGYVRRNSP
jgi:glyoxylase-like metal-dependent hydrolase (beta-lactamase superfamily II)